MKKVLFIASFLSLFFVDLKAQQYELKVYNYDFYSSRQNRLCGNNNKVFIDAIHNYDKRRVYEGPSSIEEKKKRYTYIYRRPELLTERFSKKIKKIKFYSFIHERAWLACNGISIKIDIDNNIPENGCRKGKIVGMNVHKRVLLKISFDYYVKPLISLPQSDNTIIGYEDPFTVNVDNKSKGFSSSVYTWEYQTVIWGPPQENGWKNMPSYTQGKTSFTIRPNQFLSTSEINKTIYFRIRSCDGVYSTNSIFYDLRATDYFELVKLYKATGGANWKNKWDLFKPLSTWYGVTLAADGYHVQSIDLNNNRLSGAIPNFNLSKLEKLSLNNNQLSGTIPNLSLPNLEELDLNTNELSGTIPNLSLPNLEELDLNTNELSGTIPNLNLPKLEWLYLEHNKLSGSVPKFDHSPSLEYLDITSNYFTFEGIEFDLKNENTYMDFNPQHPIPIYKSEEGVLYVKVGGGVENNTYTWYRNDEEYKTIVGDSALVVTIPGVYYCKIVNNALSQGLYNGDFVLQSNSIFAVMSYVDAKRLTGRISTQESDIVLFPNPAKGSVSIEAKGVKGKQVDIQVFDRSGGLRLERSVKQSTERISLDVSSLSHGNYYVQIKVGGKAVATKPLIISD